MSNRYGYGHQQHVEYRQTQSSCGGLIHQPIVRSDAEGNHQQSLIVNKKKMFLKILPHLKNKETNQEDNPVLMPRDTVGYPEDER